MFCLETSPGIAHGDMHARLYGLEESALLVQKVRQTRYERPKAHDGRRLDHLAVVGAEKVLVVLEEDLYIPSDSQGVDGYLGLGRYLSATPIACLLQGLIQAEAGGEQQGRTQFAHLLGTELAALRHGRYLRIWPGCPICSISRHDSLSSAHLIIP